MKFVSGVPGRKVQVDLGESDYDVGWVLPDASALSHEDIGRYRDTFEFRPPRRVAASFISTTELVLFDKLVVRHFNVDLARACALVRWAARSERPVDERLYLLEDAVSRYCSSWEYLFQVLVHFLGFSEDTHSTRRLRDAMAGHASYHLDFVDRGSATQIVWTAKKRSHALAAVRARMDTDDYVRVGKRAEQFFKRVNATFAAGSWLEEVKRLSRDPVVREVRDYRNTVAHAYPLSARMRIASGGTLPGSAICFSPRPAHDPDEVGETLDAAHKALRDAIAIVRKAIWTNDVPTSQANAGRTFKVMTCRCPLCKARSDLPLFDETNPAFFCRNCGRFPDEMEILDVTTVPEMMFHSCCYEIASATAAALELDIDLGRERHRSVRKSIPAARARLGRQTATTDAGVNSSTSR